jgi:phosphohistidine swiveling domain-containing protein
MDSSTTVTYTCADGTPFPVSWELPEDAAQTWLLNDEHWPDPMAPFEIAAWLQSFPLAHRLYDEAGLALLPVFQRFFFTHGFMYLCMSPSAADDRKRVADTTERLSARYGGSHGVWETYCLPRVRDACAALRQARPDAAVAWQLDRWARAWWQTFIAAQALLVPWGEFEAFCVERFGEEGRLLAHDLTRGADNATLAADTALWELAQQARAAPEVRAALQAPSKATAVASLPTAAGAAFRAAFDRFLADFGARCEGWDLQTPTWHERPEVPLQHVALLVDQEVASPTARRAAEASKRAALQWELEQRLATDPAGLARFRALLAPLAATTAVREDRAYWQLTATGLLRTWLLRRAQLLVEAGALSAAEDILFLLPDEVAQPAGRELAPLVAARRGERARWLGRRPPPLLRSVAPAVSAVPRAGLEVGVLRGQPASRGSVTAVVRVVAGPSEGERLHDGEVLVCVTTTPAWTPLFAVAGAVVTETGGALSHSAVVAREYGIPCVVGVRDATRWLRDGMRIEVDGDRGMVRLAEPGARLDTPPVG